MPATDLPTRNGEPPKTHYGLPHQQRSQNPDEALYEALASEMFSNLPEATEQASGISVPGARALVLDDGVEPGPDEAFMVGREFCHLHPPYDASLHLCLPVERVGEVVDADWGELHPLAAAGRVPATRLMVYAPRDRDELEVVYELVVESYRFAGGSL